MLKILTNFWFIQSIGAIALVFIILAWNSKARNKIIKLQSINFVLFIIHYLLLSAYAGAVMCGITLARNLVFVKKDINKPKRDQMLMYFFMFLSVLALIVFWKGWITILPAIGVVLGTYSISRENPTEMRFYMLLAGLVWIPYTIVVHSYSGMVSQIVSVLAITIGMLRLDWKKKV